MRETNAIENIAKIFTAFVENESSNQEEIKELSFNLARQIFHKLNLSEKMEIFGEIFTCFSEILDKNQKDKNAQQALLDGLFKALNYQNEIDMYDKFYQREKLDIQIENMAKDMAQTTAKSYEMLSTLQLNENAKEALKEARLGNLYLLGVLHEVVSEALLNALESPHDLRQKSENLAYFVVFNSIKTKDFYYDSFEKITKAVIDCAYELALEDNTHAQDLLSGVIHGTNKGMQKAIERLKDEVQFAPKGVDGFSSNELSKIYAQLSHIEENFLAYLYALAKNENSTISQIIKQILKDELDSPIAKLNRLVGSTRQSINDKMVQLGENPNIQAIRQNAFELEKVANQKIQNLRQNTSIISAKELALQTLERVREFVKKYNP